MMPEEQANSSIIAPEESANLQQQRLDYIIERLNEAVCTVMRFYANRTDVALDWNRETCEQRAAFSQLADAQIAYGMGVLTQAQVKLCFQRWIKALEVPYRKPRKILRLLPPSLWTEKG
jgi:hypothetical protein